MAKTYEVLDDKIKQYMENAEKQCRKLKTGEVSWRSAYKRICLLLKYWYMCFIIALYG